MTDTDVPGPVRAPPAATFPASRRPRRSGPGPAAGRPGACSSPTAPTPERAAALLRRGQDQVRRLGGGIAALWVAFSVWLALPWIRDTAGYIGLPASIVLITLLAFIPGALVSFLLASLAARPPAPADRRAPDPRGDRGHRRPERGRRASARRWTTWRSRTTTAPTG